MKGRGPSATRHINGVVFHFYPHSTTSKVEANDIADQLRKKGHKARVFRVYSTWNRRWQYEIFTNPAHKDLALIRKFGGGR